MDSELIRFKEIMDSSYRTVFFTGAGVSVKSGIPDFRSMGGLFDEISKDGYPPEYLLSTDHLHDNPESFISFYRKRLLIADKSPNVVHEYIAKMEIEGKSPGVITQNIDGLHRDAGSSNIDELHGTLDRFYCTSCNRQFTKETIMSEDMTHCSCGGVLRPDIVLYGEMLNERTIISSIDKISRADVLVVLGSSLVVNPAASMVDYFNGEDFIIINKDETPFDHKATLVFNKDMTEIIESIQQ